MEKANKNYNEGSDYLKTSCLRCRFNPDYSSAIPYLKLAADEFHSIGDFQKEIETREKLVKCFKNEKSYWEEGNEYEKISKVQLNQLNLPSEAYNSIENSFHAYINDHKYDYAIKALTKSSGDFIDKEKKKEAEKALSFAFEGINKYYNVIITDKDEDISYIYECIDKYIDLLYNDERYKKGAEIAKKSAELFQKENKNDKNIAKYYAYQAIGELVDKKEDKYKSTIEKGINFEGGNGLNCKINKLVNTVKEHNKNNEKIISSLFYEINQKVPNSISKMLNKYIQENKNYDDYEDNINNNNKDKDKLTDFEEDLK